MHLHFSVLGDDPEGAYYYKVQGGSNMTGTNCGLFTHNQSRSYLNHLVHQCYHGVITMEKLNVVVLKCIHTLGFSCRF
jgi:hypothetical protein